MDFAGLGFGLIADGWYNAGGASATFGSWFCNDSSSSSSSFPFLFNQRVVPSGRTSNFVPSGCVLFFFLLMASTLFFFWLLTLTNHRWGRFLTYPPLSYSLEYAYLCVFVVFCFLSIMTSLIQVHVVFYETNHPLIK